MSIKEIARKEAHDAQMDYWKDETGRHVEEVLADAVALTVLKELHFRLESQIQRIVPEANEYYKAGEAFALSYAMHDILDLIADFSLLDRERTQTAQEPLRATTSLSPAVEPLTHAAELGWLIEGVARQNITPPLKGGTCYWAGSEASFKSFTNNHAEAFRFARKEDAERVMYGLLWMFTDKRNSTFLESGLFAVEHSWTLASLPDHPADRAKETK